MISLNSTVYAVHPCLIPLVTSISISLFFSSCIFALSSLYILTGARTIGMRTIGMQIIGMEDNWHAENWHGEQLALTFLNYGVSYLITLFMYFHI